MAQQMVEAVYLCLDMGFSRLAGAEQLGLRDSSLARWVRQPRIDCRQAGAGDQGLFTIEVTAGLSQFPKEVREFRTEMDLFRLAAAYFAKEQLPPRCLGDRSADRSSLGALAVTLAELGPQ